MGKFIDITGKKFNKLTVIGFYEKSKNGARWLCECDCGNKTIVRGANLKNGSVKSCGCLTHEVKPTLTHGMSNTRLYSIYCGIKYRCDNENSPSYKNYGGRGIKMCEEWSKDFMNFRDWALKSGYKDGLTIERIDVNQGYNSSNCCWKTKREQCYNRRDTIRYNGKCLSELCQEHSMPYHTVYRRITVGKMDINEALNKPIMKQKRNKLYKGGTRK